AMNASAALLRDRQTVLADRLSRASYGPWQIGGPAVINRQELSIRGDYALGMGLLADGSAIVSHDTYLRLFGIPQLAQYQFGLVRLTPGADPAAVAAALRDALPRDVMVLTKPELVEREENYFVNVKPVGIMFQVGMFVAFIVGAVVLYQILSSEIATPLRKLTTLMAMGYHARYTSTIGIRQGLFCSLMRYLPSLLRSYAPYRLLHALCSFPVFMALTRALILLCLTRA